MTDLKPDNLFLATRDEGHGGPETVLKVLDFGIAKFQKRAMPAKGTAPGMVIGTMQYMAPEQMQGAEADPRADVYALGLILVEMLTARLPWGESKEQAYAQFALRIVVPPTPLQKLRPEVSFSPELSRLVEDMLAIEPSRRPASGSELLQRLRGVPEAQLFLRPEGSSLLERAERSSNSALPVAAGAGKRGPTELEGTQVMGRVPGLGAVPARLRLPLAAAAGLVVVLAAGLIYLAVRPREPGAAVRLEPPDLLAAVAKTEPPAPSGEKPPEKLGEKPGESGAGATASKPAHRPAHAAAGPSLQVQFAFTDAKGVSLSCGGRRLPPPECGGSGLCKSVVQVSTGQKCVAEKGGSKKVFSYSELQKNPPDRKNLIHVLVRLP